MVTAPGEEDLGPLLKRTVDRFEPVARHAGLDLTLTLPETPVTIAVDRKQFGRLIGNLLSNALKFTVDGGIEVRAELPGNVATVAERIPAGAYPPERIPRGGRYLLVAVSDTGAGIPADSLVTIFDRFVQARNRKMGKASGTGLGLAFCRKVMDAHHGFIWAESEPDRGSTFLMLFPL
ncbi:HAMP domain-containing histidine kinase, partial [bacterium]|nr:HAMP domain-containing histidine kinase [bacterium]